jgi:hypothetical protein
MLGKIEDVWLRLRRGLLRWVSGSLLSTMFDRYHPERHYMRGSGPKCGLKESKPDAPSC